MRRLSHRAITGVRLRAHHRPCMFFSWTSRVLSRRRRPSEQVMSRIHKIHAMDIRSVDLNLLVGDADLAAGFFPDLQKAGCFQQALFKTTSACIACARNDAARAA